MVMVPIVETGFQIVAQGLELEFYHMAYMTNLV